MPGVTVRRTDIVLRPDSARVVGRPYAPGEDPSSEAATRLERIVGAVVAMASADVAAELDDVEQRFARRHRNLARMLDLNAARADHLLDGASAEQRRLVGAYLTQEYAFQAAAITNPSMVPAPDQRGLRAGERRFVLSGRAIGEGHISSVMFHTGVVSERGEVTLDDVGALAETGERAGSVYERKHFSDKLRELGADVTLTAQVLDQLPRHFGSEDLERAIAVLGEQPRAVTHETVRLMRWLAASNYLLRFDPETTLQERLLWPEGPFESKGMEDARFVHFTETDGTSTYYATYTAYDGFEILPQLIETNDFCAFEMSTLSGAGAQNKGMALFPRPIHDRYVALTRPDRENIHLIETSDPRSWHEPSTPLRRPKRPWELIQMGNCGSPVETEAGWLVLTHGVGPLRTYRLGAMLLDLDDPARVIGDLRDPILEASDSERDGYVPNVVYSCGAMRHGDHLVVPYGVADQRIAIAEYSVAELIDALTSAGPG